MVSAEIGLRIVLASDKELASTLKNPSFSVKLGQLELEEKHNQVLFFLLNRLKLHLHLLHFTEHPYVSVLNPTALLHTIRVQIQLLYTQAHEILMQELEQNKIEGKNTLGHPATLSVQAEQLLKKNRRQVLILQQMRQVLLLYLDNCQDLQNKFPDHLDTERGIMTFLTEYDPLSHLLMEPGMIEAVQQLENDRHWQFAYSILINTLKYSFAQQQKNANLPTEIRSAVGFLKQEMLLVLTYENIGIHRIERQLKLLQHCRLLFLLELDALEYGRLEPSMVDMQYVR